MPRSQCVARTLNAGSATLRCQAGGATDTNTIRSGSPCQDPQDHLPGSQDDRCHGVDPHPQGAMASYCMVLSSVGTCK